MTSEIWQSVLTVAVVIGVAAGLYWLCNRFMRPFHNRAFLCLLSLIIGGYVVTNATMKYLRGEGGFKLGVDLAGGTTLEYEVDVERMEQTKGKDEVANLDSAKMVEFLKRRIDPNDLYNVTIRSVRDKYHYEIVLPTGSTYQAKLKQEAWTSLLNAVRENPEWKDALVGVDLNIDWNRDRDLVYRVRQALEKKAWTAALAGFKEKFATQLKDKEVKLDGIEPGSIIPVVEAVKAANIPTEEIKRYFDGAYKPVSEDTIKEFITKNYAYGTGGKRDLSKELIEEAKKMIEQQGSLEFRIAANAFDDKYGIDAAAKYLADPQNQATLTTNALEGKPPPPVLAQKDDPNGYSYHWVELGKSERKSLGLTKTNLQRALEFPEAVKQEVFKLFEDGKLTEQTVKERYDRKEFPSPYFSDYTALVLSKHRAENRPAVFTYQIHNDRKSRTGSGSLVFYSRPSTQKDLMDDERAKKQFDYFLLLRDPVDGKAITGENLRADLNDAGQSVDFFFDANTARLFGALTEANQPSKYNDDISHYFRYLAIILDNQVVSAPYLSAVIRDQGQIEMKSSPREDRVRLVKMLRAGALPAPFLPNPSNRPVPPTLGADNIFRGLVSVGASFAAVLLFMIVYYEFAGVVASIALLANLLLTIAFMVFVDATFTLPGLAGLVLMLGMAVDANVLIYERIREERDRGAGLSLAIRNGYDRAFPTIIDTHLTSFFTAIVLYAVGNAELRGFGISLASGLVISLFTSLYMTRLLFDVWQHKGWLKKLDMRRFFTKTNIDFMGIRNYLFAFTVGLTVAGLAVFLLRGSEGLSIDLVGGTEYYGELNQPVSVTDLRAGLKKHDQRLAVRQVEQLDGAGKVFRVTYKMDGGKQPIIAFAKPVGGKDATKDERLAEVTKRTSVLPSASLSPVTISTDDNIKAGEFKRFKFSSTESNEDIVRASVSRLLSEEKNDKLDDSRLKVNRMTGYDVKGRTVTLEFSDFLDPKSNYLNRLLKQRFELNQLGEHTFVLTGVGDAQDNHFKKMTMELPSTYDAARDREKLDLVFGQLKEDFAEPPETPKTVTASLAEGAKASASYAILASWTVILLFLWFRCGSWTFGLAAVLCLIHDLCFTLGAIAFCHYLVEWAPGLASILLIDDFKIDLPAVAALLTLVGYSVNDTIVVFDRIREVRGKNPELTFKMINDSVNQTLSRTLLAATTVFLVVLVLYLFGGESIRLFAFVMVMGVIVGTYSSIYVASPLLIMFGEGQGKARNVPKPIETTAERS